MQNETVSIFFMYRGNQMAVEVGTVLAQELNVLRPAPGQPLIFRFDKEYRGAAIESGVKLARMEGVYLEVSRLGNVSFFDAVNISRVAPAHPWLHGERLPAKSAFGPETKMAQVPEPIFGAMLNMLGRGNINLDVFDIQVGEELMREFEVTFVRVNDPVTWKIIMRRR